VPAASTDLDEVCQLLASTGLPLEGVGDQFTHGFVVVRDDNVVVGAAKLERHATVGLMRSVVVAPGRRDSGLGAALVRNRVQAARSFGLDAVYLLTTNAAPYFQRFGFVVTPRSDVPDALARSVEFEAACPASATCLVRRL
jgi:amino-acid N-acetyltransferase